MLFGLCMTAATARAYTISSALSHGCHETITTEALRRVRGELATAAPLQANEDERALIADLPFALDSDMDDLGGATLLIGVRDNDTKGRHTIDLAHLALVHGNPDAQREHCLRSPGQDEPLGSERAVADCRAFIRERFEQALDGLDATGSPDLARRTELAVWAALRHRVEPPLPTFYVRMGQALHAIEDSFTHTYRSADGLKITVVGNWIDDVGGGHDPRQHGPAHAGELDHCDKLDDLRMGRRALAVDAASETLRAALDPALSRDQKLAQVDIILDKYLSYQPGCTFDNEWCDAPEGKYGNKLALKCSFGESSSSSAPLLSIGLVALFLRRRARRSTRRGALSVLLALIWLVLPAHPALAQQSDDARAKDALQRKADDMASRRESSERDDKELNFGGYAGGGGSIDHGAIALTLGARARFRKNWIVGADAEWNPWFSDPRVIYNTENFRPGVFNFYLVGVFRLPLAKESFNIRGSVGLGFSTMLMDLYGAPRGSTGIFASVSPLALEWKMARVPYLIITPLSIVLPAPQLNGVPFVYTQYRFTVGVELYAAAPKRGGSD